MIFSVKPSVIKADCARLTQAGARWKHAWILPVLIYLYDLGFVRNHNVSTPDAFVPWNLQLLLSWCPLCQAEHTLLAPLWFIWSHRALWCQELSSSRALCMAVEVSFTQPLGSSLGTTPPPKW